MIRLTASLPLFGAILVAATAPAQASYVYHGYRFDTSGLFGRRDMAALLAAARQQVDIVEKVGLSEDTRHSFQARVIRLDEGAGGGGHFDRRGVAVNLRPVSDDRPILLHEFMHAYQAERLPNGGRNAELRTFFARAHTSGMWPADAYMLTNINEFFAMTASVYLYGHADRPPFTRAAIEQKQPLYAKWLAANVR